MDPWADLQDLVKRARPKLNGHSMSYGAGTTQVKFGAGTTHVKF